MKTTNRPHKQDVILFDLDDTLNFMTRDICKNLPLSLDQLPTYEEIKKNKRPSCISTELWEQVRSARHAYFNKVDVEIPRFHGIAHAMLAKTQEAGFKPEIFSKVVMHPTNGAKLIGAKLDSVMLEAPDIDFLFTNGDKHTVGGAGLVDDYEVNCLNFMTFNAKPALIFDHKITTLEVFEAYLNLCKHGASLPAKPKAAGLVVISCGDRVLAFKRADGNIAFPCGKLNEDEGFATGAVRELREETGVVLDEFDVKYMGLLPTENGTVVGCYYKEVDSIEDLPTNHLSGFEHEGEKVWMTIDEFANADSYYRDFNLVLLNNCKLLPYKKVI